MFLPHARAIKELFDDLKQFQRETMDAVDKKP